MTVLSKEIGRALDFNKITKKIKNQITKLRTFVQIGSQLKTASDVLLNHSTYHFNSSK